MPKREIFEVKLDTFPNMRIWVYLSSDQTKLKPGKKYRWVVNQGFDTPDVRTGEPGHYGVKWEYETASVPSTARIARWCREVAITHLAHEVDEGLRIDGKLHFNAHPKNRRLKSYTIQTRSTQRRVPTRSR